MLTKSQSINYRDANAADILRTGLTSRYTVGKKTTSKIIQGGIFLPASILALFGQVGGRTARFTAPYSGTSIPSSCPFFVLTAKAGSYQPSYTEVDQ